MLIIRGINFLQAMRVYGHAIHTQLVQKGSPPSWNYFIWSLDLFQLPDGVERASSVSLPFPVQQGGSACCLPGCDKLLGNSQDPGGILSLCQLYIFFLLLSYDNSSQTSLCNLYKAVFFCPFFLLKKVVGTWAFFQVSWYSGIQIHHDLCERCLVIRIIVS